VFRSTPSAAYTNPTLYQTFKDFGVTKLGLIYINSDFGKDGLMALEPMLQKGGMDYQLESYNATDIDFSPQIQKLRAAGVSHYCIYGNTAEIANFMKTIRRLGIDDYVFSVEGASSPQIRQVAKTDANGLVYVTANVIPDSVDDVSDPEEREYVQAYFNKYGEMPTSDTGYRTYDGACLIIEAMRNAADPEDSDAVADAFRKIKGFKGIGGIFDFTSGTGDGIYICKTYVIHGDKNVNINDYKAKVDISKPYPAVKDTQM